MAGVIRTWFLAMWGASCRQPCSRYGSVGSVCELSHSVSCSGSLTTRDDGEELAELGLATRWIVGPQMGIDPLPQPQFYVERCNMLRDCLPVFHPSDPDLRKEGVMHEERSLRGLDWRGYHRRASTGVLGTSLCRWTLKPSAVRCQSVTLRFRICQALSMLQRRSLLRRTLQWKLFVQSKSLHIASTSQSTRGAGRGGENKSNTFSFLITRH